MATLVGCHGNGLGVFLNGAINHFHHGAVVTKVDHLAASGLDDATHHIDRSVVSVEQRGRRDNANLVGG